MKKRIAGGSLLVGLLGCCVTAAHAVEGNALLRGLAAEKALEVAALLGSPRAMGSTPLLLHVHERELTIDVGANLLAQIRKGHPVLVILAPGPAVAGQGLLAVVGVRPRSPYVILTASSTGDVEANVVDLDALPLAVAAVSALVEHAAKSSVQRRIQGASTQSPGESLVPQLRVLVNRIGLDGQFDALISLAVVRNVSRTNDVKTVLVKTRSSLRPVGAGISDGTKTGENLWASRLPVRYGLGHAMQTADGTQVVLEKYLPEADGRTEFSYSKTDSNSFSIAGSLGTQFGAGATPEKALMWTSQSPFSVSTSFGYERSETLSHSFQDYSLSVTSQSPSLRWELPFSTRLGQHRLVRPTAGLPVFMPENLTPMMSTATMDAVSVWELPGSYDRLLTFVHEGGFTVHEDRWHYERADLVRQENNPVSSDRVTLDVEMGGWRLAREIPVLLQSAQGTGLCIAAAGDSGLELAACDAENQRMMWSFDEVRRYRNLATNRCMAFDATSEAVVQQPCALVNNQYWEWRADRLHSRFNLLWRLYVGDGRLKLTPDDSFILQDQPVNQFNSLDIPWSSYPSHPSKNDTMPNRNGPSPVVSDDWVNTYTADVTPAQLWQPVVVSRSLQE